MSVRNVVMGAAGAADKLYVDDVFSAYTYAGTSSTQTITNGIDLAGKGGLVWTKCRNTTFNNTLEDTARGIDNYLYSNLTNSSAAAAGTLITSVSSTGYNLSGSSNLVNGSGNTYVSYTFRKAPKFFDIVTWTVSGNPSGNPTTQSHSLGVIPGLVIIKKTSGASPWYTLARKSDGNYVQGLILNGSIGGINASGGAAGVNLTSTTFGTGSFYNNTDSSFLDQVDGQSYIAYLFAHDASTDGMIQCGSMAIDASGNGSVTLGWEPQFILAKVDFTSSWYLMNSSIGLTQDVDSKSTSMNKSNIMYPDLNSAEQLGTAYYMRTNSTGFRHYYGGTTPHNLIYVAIRRPNKPALNATQIFDVRSVTASTGTRRNVGFEVDWQWMRIRPGNGGFGFMLADRVRGVATQSSTASQPTLRTSSTNATDLISFATSNNWDSSGFNDPSILNTYSSIFISFKRSPGVFEMLTYVGTGNGVSQILTHNLNSIPEFIISKVHSPDTSTGPWTVYHKDLGNSSQLRINESTSASASNSWNNSTPSITTFSVSAECNNTPNYYIAYLFSSKTGISKIGSYTGNGVTQTINCGFSSGARFLLIKRTDSTGDWFVWDSSRGINAGNDPWVLANDGTAEVTTDDSIDPDSTGFIVNQVAATNINVSAANYIFLAIA